MVQRRAPCVLGLSTGSTPLGMYAELARMHREAGLDFSRVVSFNLDEYVGLGPNHPQSYRYFMQENFFRHINIDARNTHVPDGRALDFEAHAQQYEKLISEEGGIDLQVLGIGSDGHIAFNDPPVADFNDPLDVKLVDLDEVCRQQQVDDEGFTRLADVPLQAVTLTVPRLLRAERLYCVVPGAAKRQAVRLALEGPIAESCPASILRTHQACTLYLDRESDPHV